MALARTRRDGGMNYWPGFVDALSTLILGIIFLLSVFVVVQFFLSQEVTNKDTVLSRLNAQIAQLTELLSMEKSGKSSLEDTIATLRAGLAAAKASAIITATWLLAQAPGLRRRKARSARSARTSIPRSRFR